MAINHADQCGDVVGEGAPLVGEIRRRPRRRRRVDVGVALVGVASLAVIGRGSPSTAAAHALLADHVATPPACARARVALLALTPMSGAAVYDGLVARAAVSSPTACTMSGYPTLRAELSDRAIVTAGRVRATYLGGGLVHAASPPRLTITPHARELSFTVQFVTGNGPPCPRMDAVEFALPGSRVVLAARTIYRAGRYAEPAPLIYCGHLVVTPLVPGSSGRR